MSKEMKEKVAVYAGSFNPFTVAHARIVERALEIFDKVIICFAINPDKKINEMDMNAEKLRVQQIYANAGMTNVQVKMQLTGCVATFAKYHGCCALIRGIRDLKDFENESKLAEINKEVFGIETVLFLTENKYRHISSTLVRNLADIDAESLIFNSTDI